MNRIVSAIGDWRRRRRVAGLFAAVAVDPARRAEDLARPLPRIRFAIHFTPRSGSSWLGDLCRRSGSLGRPDEFFNPNLMPGLLSDANANRLDDYIDILQRRRKLKGVFGFEITSPQMGAVFGAPSRFHHHFADWPAVWLIREDIVRQAVSLAKMVATDVGHAPFSDAGARAAADGRFAYDDRTIAKWLRHIRAAETASEAYFAHFGPAPLRLSYERIMATDELALATRIAAHVGAPAPAVVLGESRHQRIATAQNDDFTARFRDRNRDLVAQAEAGRAGIIAALGPG